MVRKTGLVMLEFLKEKQRIKQIQDIVHEHNSLENKVS